MKYTVHVAVCPAESRAVYVIVCDPSENVEPEEGPERLCEQCKKKNSVYNEVKQMAWNADRSCINTAWTRIPNLNIVLSVALTVYFLFLLHGSIEMYCEGSFNCQNGACIPYKSICDYERNCANGEDLDGRIEIYGKRHISN